MDFKNTTKDQLIVIIGERDAKIESLLAMIEASKGIDLIISEPLKWLAREAEHVHPQSPLETILLEYQDLVTSSATLQNNYVLASQQNEVLKGQLEDAGLLVADLKSQLKDANQSLETAIDQVIVSHKGVSYRSKLKHFSLDGIAYQASDLKGNAALVAKLIEEELGVLEPHEA